MAALQTTQPASSAQLHFILSCLHMGNKDVSPYLRLPVAHLWPLPADAVSDSVCCSQLILSASKPASVFRSSIQTTVTCHDGVSQFRSSAWGLDQELEAGILPPTVFQLQYPVEWWHLVSWSLWLDVVWRRCQIASSWLCLV